MKRAEKLWNFYNYTGSGRNIWRFGNTAVSGIVGVGNLSLSALLARLKAFQLPWSNGLYSIGLSLWRRIFKTTILSLWLSWYFVGTSIFIGTTVSLVAILYCCGWETAEKQRLPQKESLQEDNLHLELLRTSNDCFRFLSESFACGNVLTTRDATSQTLYSGSEYVIKILWDKDNFSNKFTLKDSILFILL